MKIVAPDAYHEHPAPSVRRTPSDIAGGTVVAAETAEYAAFFAMHRAAAKASSANLKSRRAYSQSVAEACEPDRAAAIERSITAAEHASETKEAAATACVKWIASRKAVAKAIAASYVFIDAEEAAEDDAAYDERLRLGGLPF